MIPPAYYDVMVNTSQNLNLSYGYLMWLNGKASAMEPGLQTVFNRFLTPSAPADMFAAMGKNGQIINVVPGKGLVVVRMGEAPNTASVSLTFHESMWKELNKVIR